MVVSKILGRIKKPNPDEVQRMFWMGLEIAEEMELPFGALSIAPGVSGSFPPGATSASRLPSKGRM